MNVAGNGDDESPASAIRLDDFLKRQGLVATGGEAKVRIQAGEVMLNNQVETRRRKQLYEGDCVQFEGEIYQVDLNDL